MAQRKRRPRNDKGTSDKRVQRGQTLNTSSSSYWMNVGQLAQDATNISTFQPAGAKMQRCIGDKTTAYTPAGIMRVDYMSYFGHIDSAIDPLNVAAKRLYDEINSKNSRNPSYDPNDLMIYVIAVANAWSIWSFVRRICGMYPTFSPLNRYWWQPIVESMGISPISVRNDIVAWRNVCNRIALNLNRLAVPNNIPYFQDVIDMCSSVYMDAPTDKASFYYFNPAGILQYTYDDEKLGMLRSTATVWYDPDRTDPVQPSDVEEFFNRITVNLFNDTDINTIASDIIKAFGLENCFTLPMIDEGYAISPVYDPAMNLKLHNARIALIATADDNRLYEEYFVKQNMNVNGLYTRYDSSYNDAAVTTPDAALMANDIIGSQQIPLDFEMDNPSNVDVMEATRFTWYTSLGIGVAPTRHINACTHLLIDVSIYEFHENSSGEWDIQGHGKDIYPCSMGDHWTTSVLGSKLERISKFHCAPINYIVQGKLKEQGGYYNIDRAYLISDLTNYTTISTKTLRNINEAAIFSVFLPSRGKGSRE